MNTLLAHCCLRGATTLLSTPSVENYMRPTEADYEKLTITEILAFASARLMILTALKTTTLELHHPIFQDGTLALVFILPVVNHAKGMLSNRVSSRTLHIRIANMISLVATIAAVSFKSLPLVGWGGLVLATNIFFQAFDLTYIGIAKKN
jgi:hypothetical protein